MGVRQWMQRVQTMEVDASDLLKLLQRHLGWYPRMELGDVYKLLYQGVMGPEHMVATRQEFTRRLEAEFERLTPNFELRLLVPVRADQALFRLNLRPFKSRLDRTEMLISLVLQTSKLISGSKAELVETWKVFARLCERGEMDAFQTEAVQKYGHWLEQEDFPAVHHSEAYRREYQPAYRLISAQYLPELGLTDAS